MFLQEEINVKIATNKDIKVLADLLNLLFSQEADFCPDLKTQEKGLKMILNDPQKGHILIATKNDKIVGMVNLLYLISTSEGGKVVILEDLIVNPEYRSLGIGSILLRKSIDFSKEQGCKRITLLTDFDNNQAIQFYKKHGFEKSNMIPLRLKI